MCSDIADAMQTMMENAIEFCAEKTSLQGKAQILEARGRGDCSVCEYLRYGLAREVAEYLGTVDGNAKAVYIYDETDPFLARNGHNPGTPALAPGIRMIVWASRKSPALSTIVDSLITAVDEGFRKLPCPEANALCRQLDVVVVDDREVHERIGCGALLNSVYLHPIEIWHR